MMNRVKWMRQAGELTYHLALIWVTRKCYKHGRLMVVRRQQSGKPDCGGVRDSRLAFFLLT